MRRSTRCDSSHAQERASDRSRLRPDKSQVAAAGRIEQKGGLETLSRSSDAAFCVSPPRVSPELRWQYFLARMVSGAPSLLTSSVSDEASRSAPMHRHVACSPLSRLPRQAETPPSARAEPPPATSPLRLNRHRARCILDDPPPAISCLGAFRTPAVGARG